MAESFECPQCGAPLAYNAEAQNYAETISCPYCNESVIIPATLRRQRPAHVAPQVQVIDFRAALPQRAAPVTAPPTPAAGSATKLGGAVVGCVAIALISVLLIMGIAFSVINRATNSILQSADQIVSGVATPISLASTFVPVDAETQIAMDMEQVTQAAKDASKMIKGETATPAATATPADSPTPTVDDAATATVEAEATQVALNTLLADQLTWPIVLQEKFANGNRNWTTGVDNNNLALEERTIAGNKCTWQITTKKSMGAFTFPDMPVQTDLYISVDLQMTNNPGNLNDQAGIIFRHTQSDSTFYFFGFNPDGSYSLTMYNGSDWSDLIPPTETALGKPNQVNHLAVSMQGSLILLVINDTVVASYEDEQLPAGDAGLGVNLPSPGEDATIIFTNFIVRAPKQ